jgi:hypothetical protein
MHIRNKIKIAKTPSLQSLGIALGIVCLSAVSTAEGKALHSASPDNRAFISRRAQLVEANIIAVQAYQIMLARKAGISNACYPESSPDAAALQKLVEHQRSLLAEPAAQVVQWADQAHSSFDPAKDLQPLLRANLPLSPDLPVNVFARYLEAEAPGQPREKIRSVANLYQTILELERDGDLLQDLYRFYIALKLPVYVGQLGLPGSDADFLAAARKLAGKSCASPVDLSIPAWQIAGRKVWNWGEKNLHIRDRNTLATELLAEPQIASLIPAMKAMPPERIAIIGHSFTMDQHWSSPSSFVPIVTTMFARENSQVQFKQWSAGGLTYSRAYRNYYADALAWKPSIVLLVLTDRGPSDEEALRVMAAGFRAAGARILMFDDVEDPITPGEPIPPQTEALAKSLGVEILPARAILDAAPNHASFPCMDGIHKQEPYHRLMAHLWLKAILANR